MVVIFGKDTCPYTQAARDDFAQRGVPFQYINVKKSPTELQRMLRAGHCRRRPRDDWIRWHVRRLRGRGRDSDNLPTPRRR
jgi:glutaredoxin